MDTNHKIILSLAGLVIVFFAIYVGWQWQNGEPVMISDPGAVNIKLSQDFNLNINNSARFGDYIITFSDIVSDSRCPQGAQCFVAGDAEIELKIKKGDLPEKIANLSLTKMPVYIIDDYKLELISLSPYPGLDKQISKSQYKAGLVMIKRGGVIP